MRDRSVVYAFIDGNYLEQRHRELVSEILGRKVEIDYPALLADLGAARAYYYNAVDDEPRHGETEAALKARVDSEVARLEAINGLSNYHLRLGSVTGKAIKKRRQKQVDVQLAVDALLHAMNNNMGVAQLVLGDLDFKPLIEALVSLGVQTIVHYAPHSASKDLVRAADVAQKITPDTAINWSKLDRNLASDRMPRAIPPEGVGGGRTVNLRRGVSRLGNVTMTTSPRHNETALSWSVEGKPYAMSHPDAEVLERFFAFSHGNIEWENSEERPVGR